MNSSLPDHIARTHGPRAFGVGVVRCDCGHDAPTKEAFIRHVVQVAAEAAGDALDQPPARPCHTKEGGAA